MRSMKERFDAKWTLEPNTGCWLWTASVTADGYGHMGTTAGKVSSAHRISYQLYRGPIPPGETIDHLCRVRCCVNPDHLEVVSRRENIQRGTQGEWQKRKNHCPQGHPYSERNTIRTSNGVRRACRECLRVSWRKRYGCKKPRVGLHPEDIANVIAR